EWPCAASRAWPDRTPQRSKGRHAAPQAEGRIMAQPDFGLDDDIHPIDIVETLALHHDWDFDRLADDQIAMAVEGQWRSYSLTLAWSAREEVLRLICSFDLDLPEEKLPALYEVL